jgi:hypothetical protein
MVYVRPDAAFGIEALPSKRRSKVRRGFKKVQVALITESESYLDDMLEIVKSARERTSAGLPTRYYDKRSNQWRSWIRTSANYPGRFIFGALVSGRLVSYFFCTAVEKSLYIDAAKSHSDFLNLYANDALLFAVMDFAFNTLKVRKLVYGEYAPQDAHLNYFKESYGFSAESIPERLVLSPGMTAAYRCRHYIGSFRKRFLW